MDNIDVLPLPGIREPVNCFTHLLAVPIFATLGYFLVRRGRGDWRRTASLTIMAVATVFLLSQAIAEERTISIQHAGREAKGTRDDLLAAVRKAISYPEFWDVLKREGRCGS